MKSIHLFAVLIVFTMSCRHDAEKKEKDEPVAEFTHMVFDQAKWREKDGDRYLHRAEMLHDVVYNDTIRNLTKAALTDLLGTPDREKEGHLYYDIERKGIGSWTSHLTSMVVKIKNDSLIEWIKIHE